MRKGVASADEVGDDPASEPPRQKVGTGGRPSLRDRLLSTDPLIGLVGLVSFVVYVLHGFDKFLIRDLGVYTYGGQRFLAGDPPYVGILNRAGPLAHALPGVGIGLGRLVGVGDVHAARAFFMLMAVGCVGLVYVIVRDLTGTRAAALVGATGFLCFQGFLDLATNGPREKTAMVLFLLAAVLALLHRRWATSGVFIALGTLTWQPVFFLILVTAVVAVVLAPERRLLALARLLLGGAATSAVVLVYYALNGALHTFFEAFVLINARYTHQPSPWSHPGRAADSLREGYGPSLWLIVIGLAAVLVLGVVSALAAWRTREVVAATTVSLGAGCAAGLVWSSLAFNFWPDLFVMLPFAGIGLGGAAAALLRRLDLRPAVAVTATLVLVGTAYATVFSVTTRSSELPQEGAAIARVLRLGPHPATMMSVQAPEVMAIAGRVNPTPYQMFQGAFSRYIDDTYPGGLDGYLASIERSAPTYVVMQTGQPPGWLRAWLEEHYAKVGGPGHFIFWVDKTAVSEDVQSKMRRATKAIREASS